MAKIKTFEAACKQLKLNPKSLPKVTGLTVKHGNHILAHFKLLIIVEALNDGWFPNWQNRDEEKWQIFFDLEKEPNNPSGFRFFGAYCYCAGSYVPSRLCFKSRDLAVYAAEKFKKLYKDYFKA